MDLIIIISIIVIAVLLLFVNFYLLAVYCHPDDKGWGSSLWCKIMVIGGLALAWAQVLMLPLDVANSRGVGYELNMHQIWQILYIIILIFLTILLPFSIFIYESDEEKSMARRVYTSFAFTCGTVFIVALLLLVGFAFFNQADIPIQFVDSSVGNLENSNSSTVSTRNSSINDKTISYNVSFVIFTMAAMSFIGWILLILFGGVGLTALPIDLIGDFMDKPQLKGPQQLRQDKKLLQEKTTELIKFGEELKEKKKNLEFIQGGWGKRRKEKSLFNVDMKKFKISVMNLVKESEIFDLELEYNSHNPLVYVGKLLLGIVFIFVSLLWWLHILLYMTLQNPKDRAQAFHPFLNKVLLQFQDMNINFLATGVFAFLALYLLWCVQKGNVKFGIRIPFIFQLHPMKVNETWMNSFLFNVILILLTSVGVTQFCSIAFSQYSRFSQIDMLFNIQIRYLSFFKYFYDRKIFVIALLIWSALCLMYLLVFRKPQDKILKEIDKKKKSLKKSQPKYKKPTNNKKNKYRDY